MTPPRLRAPKEHGGILAIPPLNEAGKLVQANRSRLDSGRIKLYGRSLADLRKQARRETLAAANEFLSTLGISLPEYDGESFIVTGHQPELFHPGVWIKNFAVQGLARSQGLTPLNLIVDTDVAKAPGIRVPVLDSSSARVEFGPFDRRIGPAPYEELTVQDEDLFGRFPDEVQAKINEWNHKPLLPKLWKSALKLQSRTSRLGERLAGARRVWEAGWGCANLEVPMSRLCRTETFAWFACHILADLPRFHQLHNENLAAFRRRHHIRSRSHPVPGLAGASGKLETPFWVWRSGETRRDPLFAFRDGDVLELRREDKPFARLPVGPAHDLTPAVAAYLQLEEQGYKIRTRALTTTLFARLFLADLFIHGIGGAVYDELTDGLTRSFYGLEPPAFLTLSGTLLLPFSTPPSTRPGLSKIRHCLRDAWYNPDRHLEKLERKDRALAALCEKKQEWINRQPLEPSEKKQRFLALNELNGQLRSSIEPTRQFWRQEKSEEEKRLEVLRVLQDREYAFCLYPEEELGSFCRQFL